MSPEQARGKPVDKRADVWAFGCVLYECLTGRQIFSGETITDILGAILHREPDWKLLSPSLPPAVPRLLRRCLQRDARQRLHDIADARIILEETEAESGARLQDEETGRRGPGALVLVAGAVVLAAAGFLAGRALSPRGSTAPQTGGEVRFTLRHTPAAEAVSTSSQDEADSLDAAAASFDFGVPAVVISRDGRRLVYGIRDPDGVRRLYLREMGQLEAQPIRGTENGGSPFFSPDGEWVGFASRGELRTVRVTGGTPRSLTSIGSFKGAAWTDDEQILFAPNADAGIHRIPADGGEPEVLTHPDPELGERTHRWPQMLPDGKGFLVTVGMSDITTFDDADIAVWSAETGTLKTLVKGGMFAHYVDSGHLVFARDNSLFAAAFDLDSLEVIGRAELVVQDVVTDPLTGTAGFAVSRNSTLGYIHGKQIEAYTVRSLDMEGNAAPLIEELDYYYYVTVSPDGRRLALGVDGANVDIWIHDLERQARSRLTFEWNNLSPVWTPDGQHIAYTQGRAGTGNLFLLAADGGGKPEPLLANPFHKIAASFSPDGKVLAFEQTDPESGKDLWLLDMKERTARTFLQTPFAETRPMFSPDGRWIAYVSNETGRSEVFVRPYPGPGGKWQISVDGGYGHDWAPDGRSLFFSYRETVYRARIDTASGFRAGRPEVVFDTELDIRTGDLRPDGNGFIVIVEEEAEAPAAEIRVLVGWQAASAPRN
jgi:serine/threonine-protein kinase